MYICYGYIPSSSIIVRVTIEFSEKSFRVSASALLTSERVNSSLVSGMLSFTRSSRTSLSLRAIV